MTNTYLVLTTPTTTDVFPVRDIDRIWSDGSALRVALRPWGNNGANATAQLATTIPTEDPARALLLATQALTAAIRTGSSAQTDVGCHQLTAMQASAEIDAETAKRAKASGMLEAASGALKALAEEFR